MNTPTFRNWQSVQDEVLRRIHARAWPSGALISNEADLAIEFGCARATVNRALRALAENGLLDRRRKAGTRVAAQPIAKATLDIAVIRHEVEEQGRAYGYQLINRSMAVPPVNVSGAMKTKAQDAEVLDIAPHRALFAIDTVTWDNSTSVTNVRLLFVPGYELRTPI